MKIPVGANHHQVWKSAKAKGIKLQSKFVGVYLNINDKAPCWMARVQKDGKNLFHKRFPFNEAGEIEAGKAYQSFFDNHQETPRYDNKKSNYVKNNIDL